MERPRPLEDFERFETGFAVLYRSDGEVYKTRKPVRLCLGDERVDLSSIEARRKACLDEANVNQRLEPEVESDAIPITRAANGTLRFGGQGPPFDWALRMPRLPDLDRADERLRGGSLGDAHLRAVARRLAAFHERARGKATVGKETTLENLRDRIGLRIQAPDWPRRTTLPPDFERVEAQHERFLDEQAARFEARASSDAIRDGHGELSLEHVFIDDAHGVQILAGLEISPRFRNADVAADVALLATDLAARHRTDLAERFVAEYARLANDFDFYPLLDFYAGLRASIRAKLDWLCADREAPGSKRESRYRARSRRFLALALTAHRRPILPATVVAMGGQVASGKSTVALHIGQRIGAPVVGSDATRDYLLGARLNEDLHEARWEESYEPGFAERVYAEVLRRAEAVLESGRPVVIDGCFRSRDQRRRARALAERFGLPFLFVEARVSLEVQLGRLAERAVRDDVPIEDWQEIADRLRAQWESAAELPAAEHLVLDTGLPLDRNADAIESMLPTWPTELTG